MTITVLLNSNFNPKALAVGVERLFEITKQGLITALEVHFWETLVSKNSCDDYNLFCVMTIFSCTVKEFRRSFPFPSKRLCIHSCLVTNFQHCIHLVSVVLYVSLGSDLLSVNFCPYFVCQINSRWTLSSSVSKSPFHEACVKFHFSLVFAPFLSCWWHIFRWWFPKQIQYKPFLSNISFFTNHVETLICRWWGRHRGNSKESYRCGNLRWGVNQFKHAWKLDIENDIVLIN